MSGIAITAQTRAFLVGLIGMPAETKEGVISFYATNQNLSADDLMAAAAEVEVSEADKVKARAEANAKKLQKVEDERIRALILACTSLEAVLEHVPYADSRKKRVWLNADGSFDTDLRASKQGNTSGQGRPKKDDPTGFQSVETGEAILGGIATFVKDKVEADAFGADLLSALFTEGGNMRSREKVTAALVEGGIIEAVETDDDTSE